MITSSLKQLHNISRPGEEPRPGDVVELECAGGFVMEVDPRTFKATTKHKRFRLGDDGQLMMIQDLRVSGGQRGAKTRGLKIDHWPMPEWPPRPRR